MSVTKRDLVVEISEEMNRRLTQADILEVLQRGLDLMVDHLAQGEKIELRNFGVFEVQIRRPRIGRNPNQPDREVPIPSRAVVKFKPGKEMRQQVAGKQGPEFN